MIDTLQSLVGRLPDDKLSAAAVMFTDRLFKPDALNVGFGIVDVLEDIIERLPAADAPSFVDALNRVSLPDESADDWEKGSKPVCFGASSPLGFRRSPCRNGRGPTSNMHPPKARTVGSRASLRAKANAA